MSCCLPGDYKLCCGPTHASDHELKLTLAGKLRHDNMETNQVNDIHSRLEKFLKMQQEKTFASPKLRILMKMHAYRLNALVVLFTYFKTL